MSEQKQKTTESAAQTAPACEVFFDGSCPLCRAEIGLYRESGSDARFTDISPDDAAPPPEISRAEAMGRFHVRRADGRLVSGAAAFAELWKATPGWRWLGHIAALPPFVWIGEGLYRLFLLIRPSIQKAVRRAS
jgi:predicted DCC family thiol-disulfide oxidoreductase YuxK